MNKNVIEEKSFDLAVRIVNLYKFLINENKMETKYILDFENEEKQEFEFILEWEELK